MPETRPLTKRERDIVGRHAVKHGEVLALTQTVADAEGGIGSPLIRLLSLTRMEKGGTITSGQRAAGDRFHDLFRRAALDGLRAADMSRTPSGPSAHADRAMPSNEHCRRLVAAAVAALGGHGSLAASAAWHLLGLEWSTRRRAAGRVNSCHVAAGVPIAALGILEAHFAGRRT